MIVQGATQSFKQELLRAVHNFDTHTFKMALYSDSSDLDPLTTTAYTTTGEVSGAGYTAGGAQMVVGPVTYADGTAWVPMDNVSWPGASFEAGGAMIYNASASNKAVMIISFGGSRSFTSSSNTVRLPASGQTTSMIRIY